MAGHSPRSLCSSSVSGLAGFRVNGTMLEPSLRGVVYVAERGLMVAHDCELERREESEEVLAHKSSGDRIAAGYLLDAEPQPRFPALFVSLAVTSRAPRSMARSVGCLSPREAVNRVHGGRSSIGA